ncbi:MAG TPA: flagellar basal body rod protein FlgB [Candidatus Marinimicrobia bacterium]|nr:flagellar basal body rod protein FlgB [Candidatus Neomarinimicrobiota bacterium]
MEILNTNNSQLLKRAVQVYDRQHRAISENIANVNNPGYRKKNTDFSAELEGIQNLSKMRMTHEKHLRSEDSNIIGSADEKEQEVDLTEEMGNLAQNQIKHEFVAMLLQRYYSGLSTAISGQPK